MRKATLLAGLAAVVAAMTVAIPALAQSGDSNNDSLPDRWEARYHLPLNVNQAPRDQDQDGLKNRGEYRHHTDPRDADSDENGTEDGPQCTGHNGPPGPNSGGPGGGQVPPETGPVAP